MKMEFTYDDFIKNYLHSEVLKPIAPLRPVEILDQVTFSEALESYGIDKRIRNTFSELERRMGEEYFSKFERVQTRASEIGALVFPPYKMLFLDITCEDWLSLVDFHKGFNRDHSIHQPLTAYIVSKILGGGNPNKAFKMGDKSILEMAVEVITTSTNADYLLQRLATYDPDSILLTLDKALWTRVFYQTAIITAMYHDMGYPWQFIERMHDTLDDKGSLCGKLADGDTRVKEFIEKHKDELLLLPFYDYGRGPLINEQLFEKALHSTHGLPGAIAFDSYNKKYRSDQKTENSELIKFCQEWCCLAIMMHDMGGIYGKNKNVFPRLDFSVDPLSFIIALADTLEDFNRPNAIVKPTEKGCSIEYSFPSLSVDLEEDKGKGVITYQVVAENKDKQEKFKKEDQIKLFDPSDGYFNLASIGLNEMIIQCK